MKPLTFNPGPSQLSSDTEDDIRLAVEQGIPSISHRSDAYRQIGFDTLARLRTFFGIPEHYSLFFTSSATEAMELVIRNNVTQTSCHFTNGRFSELFAEISESYGHTATKIAAPWGKMPSFDPALIPRDCELVTVTYNETSTGAMCRDADIARIRQATPDAVLAVDITSIAGMKALRIADADLWLFSVQKGFGLPAGLGVLIVSSRALERAKAVERTDNHRMGMYTFSAMDALARKGGQTIATPNVLGILLLGRQLARWNAAGGIAAKEEETRAKAKRVSACIERSAVFRHFIAVPEHRSISVACIESDAGWIAAMHRRAAAENIVLGKGYGKLKETTLRLGLFPAIGMEDVERLVHLINGCA